MPGKKYILKINNSIIPIIKNGVVENDKGAGGIKLIYRISSSFSLGRDSEIIIFLKPFKKFLGTSKKEVENNYGKGSWGNTYTPLSNVWLKLSHDYKDINKDIFSLRPERVTEQILFPHLNKQEEYFIIGEDVKLSIIDKIPFYIGILKSLIKNK